MKFGTATIVAVIGAAVAASMGTTTQVEAFSPSKGLASTKAGILVPEQSNSNSSPLWRPPKTNIDMVAGGAERAAGQEYYEGTSSSSSLISFLCFCSHVWQMVCAPRFFRSSVGLDF